MPLRERPPGNLKRLGPQWYRGTAWVHWVMGIEARRHGWLDDGMHAAVRELMVHTCIRYRLICPAYCLMPNHGHFLWMGLCRTSDQLPAAKFFRRHWTNHLNGRGVALQRQAYDHVLNEHERDQTQFEDTLYYILHNPQDAGLIDDWGQWPHMGCVAAGYPELDPRSRDRYPAAFWKIHNLEVRRLAES